MARVSATLLGALMLFGARHAAAEVVVFAETFEGAFPGTWTVGDDRESGATWRNVDAAFGGESTASGSRKGYCAGTLYADASGAPTYPADMRSYMERSVNLTPFDSAALTFWYKMPSLESCCDRARVKIGDAVIWSCGTSQAGWTKVTLDLASYVGAAATVRFEFESDSSGTGEGWYLDDITLSACAPSPNDEFANAVEITGPSGESLGANCGATAETGEVYPGGGHTVWWKWTAPSSACVFFTTVGSTFDTMLCVYEGAGLNNLVSVACNDDSASDDELSRVSFSSKAGTTYWIQIDGWMNDEGLIELSWGANSVPPVNDSYAAAMPLQGTIGLTKGENCNATSQPGEPGAEQSPGATVWWLWTAPRDMWVTFTTCGSAFDTRLWAYSGDDMTGLTLIDFDDDDGSGAGFSSAVQFAATGGATYRIRLDGFNYATGAYNLQWGCLPTKLNIKPSGNDLVLSWDVPGFTLQGTTSLNSGAAWTTLGTTSPVTNAIPSGNKFFRLICQ